MSLATAVLRSPPVKRAAPRRTPHPTPSTAMNLCLPILPSERAAAPHVKEPVAHDPAAEFDRRSRRWAALALNAPQGHAGQQHALTQLRAQIVDVQAIESGDCGPRLAHLMHRELADLHHRPGVELVARHSDLAQRIGTLLQILQQAERPSGLNPIARLSPQGRAVADAVESAVWEMVERLDARSPRLACMALIELIAYYPETRHFPTPRIRALCEQTQARLTERLIGAVDQEAWSSGTLVLRLIHDSAGASQHRRQIGAVLDQVFPLVRRQDPGLAQWLLRAGERALHRVKLGVVWRDPGLSSGTLQGPGAKG